MLALTVFNVCRRAAQVALTVALSVGSIAGYAVASPVAKEDIAERTEALPARLSGVDVKEQLGGNLPNELVFEKAEGGSTTLGQLQRGDRPLIVTMNYSNCPMLCSLQLSGVVQSLKQVDRVLGRDYDLITVSVDPTDTKERLSAMKERYLLQYLGMNPPAEKAEAARQGWHFLHGSEADIKSFAQAIGFSYSYNEKRAEYAHPAAIVLVNPKGMIARYLYGLEYHPRTVDLSLVEVSEGKIGGSMEKMLLFCFHYDETEGRYAPVARNIMRLGGGVAAVALAAFLASFWIREGRKPKIIAAS